MENIALSPLHQALDVVRCQIVNGSYTPEERLELVGSVDFFCKQILCDMDRRESEITLASRWRSFERRFLRHLPPHEFKGPVSSCLLLRRFFYLQKKTHEGVGRDVCSVLQVLRSGVRRSSDFSAIERDLCLVGLKYLEIEAGRFRHQRDQLSIRGTWRRIYPSLLEKGFLRRVRGVDLEVRQNFYLFLTGEIEEAG